MILDMPSSVAEYCSLLTAIKQQISDPSEVLAIFREISEDMRQADKVKRSVYSYDSSATAKQIAYLKAFGSIVTQSVDLETLTKKRASELIKSVNNLRAIVTKVANEFNLFN